MYRFTSMYPVRLAHSDDPDQKSVAQTIVNTKEMLRAMPNKGVGFGAVLPEQLNRLPQISFNYLGQFGGDEATEAEHTGAPDWQLISADENNPLGDQMSLENVLDLALIINGGVQSGQLQFSVVSRLAPHISEFYGRCAK